MAFLVTPPAQKAINSNPMEDGMNPAQITAVVDLGMVAVNPVFLASNRAAAVKEGRDPNTVPAEVHKCRIEYTGEDGKLATEEITVSLHAKAKLHARIKSITGTAPAPDKPLDIEALLLGQPVIVQAERGISKRGNAFVNVVAVARQKGAKKTAAPAPKATKTAAKDAITDDDLGF